MLQYCVTLNPVTDLGTRETPSRRFYCKGRVILYEWYSFFLDLIFSDSDVACRGNSLGMEDDTIPGGGILASSWYSQYVSYAPSQGRLNNEDGSWCPNKTEEDPNPYLQVRAHNCLREHGEKNCLPPKSPENLPVFVGQKPAVITMLQW